MSEMIIEREETADTNDLNQTLKVYFDKQEEGGYTVIVPELPGLITEGDDFDDALDNLLDAYQEYLLSFSEGELNSLNNYHIIFEVEERNEK